MTTVPKAGDPPPANKADIKIVGPSSEIYVRPTAGGNASGTVESPPGSAQGSGGTGASAGPVPSPASVFVSGAPPSAGGTQAGPDMGHGATQILTGISGGGDTDNDGDTL